MAVVESIREIREALILVSQLASSLNGTFGVSICGIPKQIAQHRRLFSIIEDDVDNFFADAYRLKDAYELQKALQAVYEVTIHVQSPSVTPLGKSLKQLASMLHVGIERKNIANSMILLMEVARKVGIGERQKARIEEHSLLDKKLLVEQMKEDVAELPQAFRNQISELKTLAPHLSGALNEAQQKYLDACAKYDNNMHALEVPELSLGLTRLLHEEIVKEESKINPSNLHINEGDVLGEGLFGTVRSATLFSENKGGVPVEVRSIEYKKQIFKREYVTLMNEITYWANFPHDYATILKFNGLCLDNGKVHLVTESYPFTLQRALHEEHVALSGEQAERIAGEIILALMQLHDLNIMHRNLNPSNILFESKDATGKVKVSDFGLGFSKYFQHQEGASQYYAPEVLTSKPEWTFATDIYAFGLIAWELYQDDKEPFEDEKYYLYDHVVVGKNRPDPTQGKLKDFRFMQTICERCWAQDPVRRPLAGTVAEATKTRKPMEAAAFAPRPPMERKKPEPKEVAESVMEKRKAPIMIEAMVAGKMQMVPLPAGPAPEHMRTVKLKNGKTRVLTQEEHESLFTKRGSFSRMNGQVIELSRNSMEAIEATPVLSVQEAVELVNNNREYAQHQGQKLNKRLSKLTVNELCNDFLEIDTPVFYSFYGQAKVVDYDCAVIGELLKVNRSWLRLGLNFNRIGNLGLSYLAKGLEANTRLRKLYLTDNKISRIGPLEEALRVNTTLKFIEMDANELGDIAATSVRKILETNSSLLYLSLSKNLFTNDGAADIAAGLKKNNTLREFHIGGHEKTMQKKGRRMIKNACKGKDIKLRTWGI